MKTITEQDVLKAFYQFDCRKLPVLDINGNLSPSLDVMMRKNMCAEWMDAFDGLEADLFAKAVQIALKKCKKYPSLSEMFEFIALADGDCTRAEQPEPETAVPAPAIPASASEQKKKRIAAMLAAAKTGDYKKALECAAGIGNDKEFYDFARQLFPDAAAEWIGNNRVELDRLMKQERRCSKCGSARRCRTNGYRLCWHLDEKGQIATTMEPCFMKMGVKNENVQ